MTTNTSFGNTIRRKHYRGIAFVHPQIAPKLFISMTDFNSITPACSKASRTVNQVAAAL